MIEGVEEPWSIVVKAERVGVCLLVETLRMMVEKGWPHPKISLLANSRGFAVAYVVYLDDMEERQEQMLLEALRNFATKRFVPWEVGNWEVR